MKRTILICLVLMISGFTAMAQVAKVIDAHGDVTIKQNDTAKWIKAVPQMYMEKTAQIKTGDDSSCVISFDEELKNIIAIKENTQINLEKISPVKIFMPSGRVFSIIDNLTKLNEFIIRTPTAIAGVRGTGEYVEFNGIETIIRCFEGKLEAYDLDHNGNRQRKRVIKENYYTKVPIKGRIKEPSKLDIDDYQEWFDFKANVKKYRKENNTPLRLKNNIPAANRETYGARSRWNIEAIKKLMKNPKSK
jgi:FecR protein